MYIEQPYFDEAGRYVGTKIRSFPHLGACDKQAQFALLYGASRMYFDPASLRCFTDEQYAMMERFPKEGKFSIIYKDVDDEPQYVTSSLRVIPHTTDQFCWVDGVLYEHDQFGGEWDRVELSEVAQFIIDNAVPSSIVFLTMGDTVVFEEHKTVTTIQRKG